MTLWANLHGGFAFGLALIAPAAVQSVVTAVDRRSAARSWALFALAAVAAALVNPFGVEGLLFPVRLLGLKALARDRRMGAGEFRPSPMRWRRRCWA